MVSPFQARKLPVRSGVALAINDAGVIVGTSSTPTRGTRPLRWLPGSDQAQELPGLQGDMETYWTTPHAINAGGTTYADGAATTYWTFTTVVAAPGAFVHSSPANGSSNQSANPTLSWTAGSGAASYEYCIDTSNNGVWPSRCFSRSCITRARSSG